MSSTDQLRTAFLDRLESLAKADVASTLPGLIAGAVVGLQSLSAQDESTMISQGMYWTENFIDNLQGLGNLGYVPDARADSNQVRRNQLMEQVKTRVNAMITTDKAAADAKFQGMWLQSAALAKAEEALNGYVGDHIALLHRFATQ